MNFDYSCFVADVESYNPITGVAMIAPRFVYQDGSKPEALKATLLEGIIVEPGDLVAVITMKNNLDNETVNAYFPRSLANCRIFAVIEPMGGIFLFKGDYTFEGEFIAQSDAIPNVKLSVTADGVTIETLLTTIEIQNDQTTITIGGQSFTIQLSTVNSLLDIIQSSGRSAFADGYMTPFGPTISRIPGGNP